jgi:co-chaperonin GroES (HSP10)
VSPYEFKTELVAIPDNVKERQSLLENRVVVIEAGAAAWSDEEQPRAYPGDKVMVTKYAGHEVTGTADGKPYRLVNDRDIFCQINIEKESLK